MESAGAPIGPEPFHAGAVRAAKPESPTWVPGDFIYSSETTTIHNPSDRECGTHDVDLTSFELSPRRSAWFAALRSAGA